MKTLQKTLRKILTREEFVEKFYSKSKSSGSKSVITSVLNVFDDFCLNVYGNNAEKMLWNLREDGMGDALYNFLQDFINYMEEKNLKPKTIASYFSTFRTYLRSQGIKISSDDIKDLIRLPEIIQELREPLTKEHLKLLLDYSKPERKALYLTLLSSGMRIGESLSLKKSDFDLSSDPIQITIQGKFTKTKQTRQTYISSEAKVLLLRILAKKHDNELVFAKSVNLEASRLAEERTFDNLRNRCGLTEKYPDSNRHKITIHSMRAYFHTQASLVHDEQYANALDGHQGYLMQYYRLSPETRSKLYQKLEPFLCVYGNISVKTQELEDKIKSLEEKDSKYQKISDENQSLRAEIARQGQALEYLLRKDKDTKTTRQDIEALL
ncbi:MAG: tyrosine-type recombinase/integrase [Nitrosopumilus sp.]|nr:tyrosine-type recombinase/integrase [Nitrosopumilus sp.]MDH3852970.1 tyrosine-type recombinase/integrase [Nitrosopumilus sp.]